MWVRPTDMATLLRSDGYSRFCAQNSEFFPRPTNRPRDHPTPIYDGPIASSPLRSPSEPPCGGVTRTSVGQAGVRMCRRRKAASPVRNLASIAVTILFDRYTECAECGGDRPTSDPPRAGDRPTRRQQAAKRRRLSCEHSSPPTSSPAPMTPSRRSNSTGTAMDLIGPSRISSSTSRLRLPCRPRAIVMHCLLQGGRRLSP